MKKFPNCLLAKARLHILFRRLSLKLRRLSLKLLDLYIDFMDKPDMYNMWKIWTRIKYEECQTRTHWKKDGPTVWEKIRPDREKAESWIQCSGDAFGSILSNRLDYVGQRLGPCAKEAIRKKCPDDHRSY